jgi:protein tyrosine/serine phosphatase
MPRVLRWLFSLVILALLVGGPLGYSHFRQAQLRNFRVVRDGVLYRSGQMSLSGLKLVVQDYRIKTVISLRDAVHEGDRPPDWREEAWCQAEEITYHRIRQERWWASDETVPAEKGIERFRKIMDDPANYPVLIHCFAGIHRTGAYCAVYRMEYEHWSNEKAIDEMRACGYRNIDDEFDLLGYLEKYQPRWKKKDGRTASAHQNQSYYRPAARSEFRKAKPRKRTRKKTSS